MSTQGTKRGDESLLREAAQWFERVHDEARLESIEAWQSWLDRSEPCRRAFRSIEKAWWLAGVGASAATEAQLRVDTYDGAVSLIEWRRARDCYLSRAAPASASQQFAKRTSLRRLGRPFVAVGVLALAAWLATTQLREQGNDATLANTALLKTASGEHRQFTLADGSRVAVGASSRISVNFTRGARNVVIEFGAAYFDVLPDSRPFYVLAGNGRITATGTAFNVLRLQEKVVVTVVEGSVEVVQFTKASDASGVRRPVDRPQPSSTVLRLKAGEEVSYGYATAEVQAVDPGAATAWRQGMLKYLREPLKFVVQDVDRYTDLSLEVVDPEAGELLYTGTVLPDEIGDWLISLTYAFPVEIRYLDDERVEIFASGELERTRQ